MTPTPSPERSPWDRRLWLLSSAGLVVGLALLAACAPLMHKEELGLLVIAAPVLAFTGACLAMHASKRAFARRGMGAASTVLSAVIAGMGAVAACGAVLLVMEIGDLRGESVLSDAETVIAYLALGLTGLCAVAGAIGWMVLGTLRDGQPRPKLRVALAIVYCGALALVLANPLTLFVVGCAFEAGHCSDF